MKHPKCAHSFEVVSELPEPIRALRDLAYNFRWTWHFDTRMLFREIDKTLWEAVEHNPIVFLRELPQDRIQRLAEDPVFLAKLKQCSDDLKDYVTQPRWFEKTYADLRGKTTIAYFCAEFGVSEALPIYSGGLGVLAGDHLKAASDLGIPLVGVGLLYSRGYFRQFLSPDGWQQEHYQQYDFYQLPLQLIRGEDQEPLRIKVEFPDRVVTCQVWRADVGRIPLYLLDSNVLENEPNDQGITDTLYGGDDEMRIRQEMILGLGGMRALRALGIEPTVCHMNEGHAAFLSLERIRQYMQDHNCDFRTARQVIVNGNVFTTHTPVDAGFDRFTPDLMEKYATKMASAVGVAMPDFVKMGKVDPENPGEAFNMAVLAMENANYVNGVSKLHAAVTRRMFHDRWAGFPEDEVPINAVTNGVHTLTWLCKSMEDLFDSYLDPRWRDEPDNAEIWKAVWSIPDRELWEARESQRARLIRFIRLYIQQIAKKRGLGRSSFGQIESVLDPRTLTIGFARRFASYKRATLMLLDRERLKGLLLHPERPIQIVIAGKAHPRDDEGKKLIQELVHFINDAGVRHRMVFLEDYDMKIARYLVQGVDVWLNNPRRPWEASGTSGMKAVPNGVLNCSVLDGWWDEGYKPGVGWAIGDRYDLPDHGQQDWLDSKTLYHLIENEIAPNFYHRVDGSVPLAWVEMVKRSICDLAPQFSTSRMVRDYCQNCYVPAARGFTKLTEDNHSRASGALSWRDRVRSSWGRLKIVSVKDTAKAQNPLGVQIDLEAKVDLDGLSPEDVQVQAVSGMVGSNRDLYDVSIRDMEHVEAQDSVHMFRIRLESQASGHRGYTVRVIPRNDDINVISELPLVLWEG